MTAADPARFRWLVLAVFVLSSAINYLDRMTLAMLKPVIVVKSAISSYGVPPGHRVRPSEVPPAAFDAMLRQAQDRHRHQRQDDDPQGDGPPR